jgi:hypothetical protein
MSTDSEAYSMSDFWKIMPKGSSHVESKFAALQEGAFIADAAVRDRR